MPQSFYNEMCESYLIEMGQYLVNEKVVMDLLVNNEKLRENYYMNYWLFYEEMKRG